MPTEKRIFVVCRTQMSDVNSYTVSDAQRDAPPTTASSNYDNRDSVEETGAVIYTYSETSKARAAAVATGAEAVSTKSDNADKLSRIAQKQPSSSTIATSNETSEGNTLTEKNKKRTTYKSFERRIEELRAYKEKHGHVRVKHKDDMSLYYFCIHTRWARNNPGKSDTALSDDRIVSLDALGFEWTVKKQAAKKSPFEKRMDDLREYREKHGHVSVKKSEDKSLYNFCYNIRHARKHPEKSTLLINEERIASLDAVGFDWTVREYAAKKSFEQRIEDLQAYKEKHGHIYMKKSDDKSLYDFHRNIRKARNNPVKSTTTVTENRIASLDAVAFEWTETDRKSFEKRLEGLRAYKQMHGHVNVSPKEDNGLYQFCHKLKKKRNIGSGSKQLAEDHISALDALGFDWAQNTYQSFEERLEDLQAYKEKHGHVYVKWSEDKSLYNFCRHIRRAHQNPEKSKVSLTYDRIASLDALGFDWRVVAKAASVMNDSNQSPSSYELCSEVRKRKILSASSSKEMESAPKKKRILKSFEQRIEDLKAYKEKHGHINVIGSDDKSLYYFCQKIRYARNNPGKSRLLINEKRIANLDALGFNWSVKEQAAKKSFEQRLEDLRAYKEKYGHVDVKRSDDKSLYDFCNHMSRARNNPEKSKVSLTDDRIASLDALGFDWRTSFRVRASTLF